MPAQLAWLPAAIAAAGSMISDIARSRRERKAYKEMQAYNTPKSQMQRFQDAGLSPYLMYGQGTAGNMTEASPVQETGLDKIPNAIGHYAGLVDTQNQLQDMRMRTTSFPVELQQKKNEMDASTYSSDIAAERASQERYKTLRMGLDLASDYNYDTAFNSRVFPGAEKGFRFKMNEMKKALSEAQLEQLQTTVQGLKSRNIVDAEKARYASDYGMVGGDWTQGLGLLRNIGGWFKGGKTAKVTHELESIMKTGRRTIRRRTYER